MKELLQEIIEDGTSMWWVWRLGMRINTKWDEMINEKKGW